MSVCRIADLPPMFCKKASAFLFMKSERLVFRSYDETDKADFISLFTDAAVMKYVDKGVLTFEQAGAFWSKLFDELYPQNFNIWAVFTNEDSRYVGHAGIYPCPSKKEDWEFVYFLRSEAWGKGYATEIARKIIEYGFEELKLLEVFATVDDEHRASIRVLEKSGMKFERFEFDEQGRFSVYSTKKS